MSVVFEDIEQIASSLALEVHEENPSLDDEFDALQEAGKKYLSSMLCNIADATHPNSPNEMRVAINNYFTACHTTDTRPTATGFALAIGLASTSGIKRLGMRRPDFREMLGRALVAIEHGYEAMIGKAPAQGIIYALNNLPDGFDMEEPDGSDSPTFWQQRQELTVNNTFKGMIEISALGNEMSAQEAYAKVIEGEAVKILDIQENSEKNQIEDKSSEENSRPSWMDEIMDEIVSEVPSK